MYNMYDRFWFFGWVFFPFCYLHISHINCFQCIDNVEDENISYYNAYEMQIMYVFKTCISKCTQEQISLTFMHGHCYYC